MQFVHSLRKDVRRHGVVRGGRPADRAAIGGGPATADGLPDLLQLTAPPVGKEESYEKVSDLDYFSMLLLLDGTVNERMKLAASRCLQLVSAVVQ